MDNQTQNQTLPITPTMNQLMSYLAYLDEIRENDKNICCDLESLDEYK